MFECSQVEPGSGAIGLYAFGRAVIRKVNVDGTTDSSFTWDDSGDQPTNWFYPYDNDTYGKWQMPQTLVRAPNGELVLWFGVMEEAFKGKKTVLITRSGDDGRTWSEPDRDTGLEWRCMGAFRKAASISRWYIAIYERAGRPVFHPGNLG